MSVLTLDGPATGNGVESSFESGETSKRKKAQKARLKEEPMKFLDSTPLDDLETPAIVGAMLARIPGLSSRAQKEYEREFKLSYYYEGLTVALLRTESGSSSVVASGPAAEVFAVLKAMPRTQSQRITLIDPQPLKAIAAQLLRHK